MRILTEKYSRVQDEDEWTHTRIQNEGCRQEGVVKQGGASVCLAKKGEVGRRGTTRQHRVERREDSAVYQCTNQQQNTRQKKQLNF